jgi:hypothetical protein
MADLANANRVRERLYMSKQIHFFKPFLSKPTLLESIFDRSTWLTGLLHQIPAQQFAPVPQTQQVYNDTPPGKGFVMR